MRWVSRPRWSPFRLPCQRQGQHQRQGQPQGQLPSLCQWQLPGRHHLHGRMGVGLAGRCLLKVDLHSLNLILHPVEAKVVVLLQAVEVPLLQARVLPAGKVLLPQVRKVLPLQEGEGNTT